MEISKTECKRILRTLELKAYRSVVDALRAQGTFTHSKHEVLKNLAATFSVSEERYRSEIRRAANDDLLNTIAQRVSGKSTEAEWRAESVKKVPLTPMVASQTAFTALADTISDIVALENEKFSNSTELKNAIESYKCRGDTNLKKYSSSKLLETLLEKRKNHHQDAILSELEKIKLNNNYHQSPVKPGYIEVSYDEDTNEENPPVENHKSVSWKLNDDHAEPSESSKLKLQESEKKNPSDVATEKKNSKRKFKSKKKIVRKSVENETSNTSNHTCKTRNLRVKPFKKYTLNSVEIRTFDDQPEESTKSKRNKPSEMEKISQDSDESDIEVSRKSAHKKSKKRRVKVKAKQSRSNTLTKVRKLNNVPRPKSEKEVPRKSRISMRNARRRNYARLASGDYDISEFRKMEVDIKNETEDSEEKESTKESDDSLSDSSNAPIEVSYANPAPPPSSNFELEGVNANFTDDDMKPHTFNLIPASRRLKMLKKRPKSPSNDESSVKKIALSESNQTIVGKTNDINSLRKILAAHENITTVASCNINDLPENMKEMLDISNRAHSSVAVSCDSIEIKTSPVSTPTRTVFEKRPTKPKMKLSEASTIENLHSLLSKVKEGDLKRLKDGAKKMPCRARKEPLARGSKTRVKSPIESIPSESLIEVNNLENGTTSSLLNERDDSSKDSDSDEIIVEDETSVLKQVDEEVETISFSNDEEVVSIILDDIEDVSEQLIDIESADIIISDSGDQNGDFIITENQAAIVASTANEQAEVKTYKNVRLLEPKAVTLPTNDEKLAKDDIIIINVDENEVSSEEKISKTSSTKSQTDVKQMLSAASDFRYVADADDPLLKKSAPSKENLLTVLTPLTNSTNVPNIEIKPISVESSAEKSSQSISSVPNTPKPNRRQFVLIEAKNKDSLLKPIKNLPKILPASNSASNVVIQKSKKLTIYSSLKNINTTTVSSFPKNTTVRTTNVTSLLRNDDAGSNVKSESETVVKLNEKDPKRLMLSQAIENSVKLIEATKKSENSANELASSVNFDKMIEISSYESPAGESVSNNVDGESDSVNDVREIKTFFTKNIIRRNT